MKTYLSAGAALLLTTSMAHAVGLDRSNQNIGVIFEDTGATGSYVELSYGFAMPDLTGEDDALFGSGPTGNVAEDYGILGMAFKYQYSDAFSAAVIFDQPYGASIEYPVGDSIALGGTAADVDSESISVLGRYDLGNGFSAHGGLRVQRLAASVSLAGAAYPFPAGYSANFDDDTAVGYTLGAAYERPDIALRVALTYFSEIDHELDTQENFGAGFVPTGTTDVTTPQAVNLDFQTGVAPGTLVFGQIRWADYDEVQVVPAQFGGATGGTSLVGVKSNFAYSLGVGRQLTDNLAGSFSVGYEPTGDDLVSPLGPTNGNYSVALGAAYTFDTGMELSGGIRYIRPGDASAATGGEARARFEDNDAIAIGLKVAYAF